MGIDFEKTTEKKYLVDSMPDFYLIDRAGILRFADVSNHKANYITDAIEALLEEPPPPAGSEENADPEEKLEAGQER